MNREEREALDRVKAYLDNRTAMTNPKVRDAVPVTSMCGPTPEEDQTLWQADLETLVALLTTKD